MYYSGLFQYLFYLATMVPEDENNLNLKHVIVKNLEAR